MKVASHWKPQHLDLTLVVLPVMELHLIPVMELHLICTQGTLNVQLSKLYICQYLTVNTTSWSNPLDRPNPLAIGFHTVANKVEILHQDYISFAILCKLVYMEVTIGRDVITASEYVCGLRTPSTRDKTRQSCFVHVGGVNSAFGIQHTVIISFTVIYVYSDVLCRYQFLMMLSVLLMNF